jgi:hypothetical protein
MGHDRLPHVDQPDWRIAEMGLQHRLGCHPSGGIGLVLLDHIILLLLGYV